MAQHEYLANLAHKQGGSLSPHEGRMRETFMPACFPRVSLEDDQRTPVAAWKATEAHAWEALLIASLWEDEVADAAHEALRTKFSESATLASVLEAGLLETANLAALLETLVAATALEVLEQRLRGEERAVDQDHGRSHGLEDADLRAQLDALGELIPFLSGRGQRYSTDAVVEKLDLIAWELERDVAYREFINSQRTGPRGNPTTPHGLLADRADVAMEALPDRQRDDLIAGLARDFLEHPFGEVTAKGDRDAARRVREFLKESRRKRSRRQLGTA